MKKISIVIPVFNNYQGLHQLLSDIKQNCGGVDEVIIADDCSTDEDVFKGVRFWKNLRVLPINYYENDVNLGFLLNSNNALKYVATGDIKILISTDVRIHAHNFLDLVLGNQERNLQGGVVYYHDTGWNKFDDRIFPYVEGWLLSATSELWNDAEYFDIRYAPSDFEDVDLSTKVLASGGKLVEFKRGSVSHVGGASYGYTNERLLRTKRNQEYFRRKWTNG